MTTQITLTNQKKNMTLTKRNQPSTKEKIHNRENINNVGKKVKPQIIKEMQIKSVTSFLM